MEAPPNPTTPSLAGPPRADTTDGEAHASLGILAGGGPLPGRVAAAAHDAGRPVFLIGLEGFADPAVLAPWPHEVIRMGAVGRILAALRAHGCRDLVLIGTVRRPSFLDARPDLTAARLIARAGRAVFSGDNTLLSGVVRALGDEGFRVLGAHEILGGALGPRGLLSRAAPDDLARADISRGAAVARALGAVDVGQGCVVRLGVVVAVEAVEGTDAMLARAGPLLDLLGMAKPGGVLVKRVKPAQDRRVDLPTIGPDTIRNAAAAGLAGIAYEANGTILADREATIAAANHSGLFLLGFDPEDT